MSSLQKLACVFFASFFFITSYSHASSSAFTKVELETLKQKNMGKQWLMLMWSVDCPPCFKELAVIKKLKLQGANLNVVLVNADASNEVTQERVDIIEEFQLNSLENFHFIDGKAEYSRFIIDSSWFGELPRSYFIDTNGKFHGKSGLVNESLLTRWLVP